MRFLLALSAQLLPGLFAARLLGVGRSREERLVAAAILGGPLSALFHLASLLSGVPELYWLLTGGSFLGALVIRSRPRPPFDWPRSSLAVLAGILVLVLVPYLATTGSLYRVDPRGELLLDRALQRDALFHLGIARSLETSYPPRLLSVGGEPVGYHAGYHLQIALWSRHFGIDPADGLVRLAPALHLALLLLGAYLLAARLSRDEGAKLLSAALVFGSGFGFLFFFRPSVDWWSLTFMDWGLVSILLANPLLPALPLLFLGLALTDDYVATGAKGALAAGVFALAFLFEIKIFVGAQLLAAIGLALLPRARERRARTAFAALALACSPALLHAFFAASGSNTSVALRPLEIVRYSMEKLDWRPAVAALARAGAFETPERWLPVAGAVLLWCVGFLGLRLAALPWVARSLRSRSFLPAALSWFVLIGFPLSLVLRIAPAEARGLSRLEALNDAGWFATASGFALWFPTGLALSRLRLEIAGGLVLLLAFPATIQHFLHAGALGADRVGKPRVAAMEEAKRISSPESTWLEPLDRARPSLLPYFSGRAVVYDPYVGYDYMFVGRDEIDFRRHAAAHFWTSTDASYQAWFLDRFSVDFVWRDDRELPGSAGDLLEPVFANAAVEILKVREEAVRKRLETEIAPPGSIPTGGRGHPFYDSGWLRPDGESRRLLVPERAARLYLPAERGRPEALTLVLSLPHDSGELRIDEERIAVERSAGRVSVPLAPSRARGLRVVELAWRSPSPLGVSGIEIARDSVARR